MASQSALANDIIQHIFNSTDCQFHPIAVIETCRHCSRTFLPGSKMFNHIEMAHGSFVKTISADSNPFYCVLCKKSFPSNGTDHVADFHNDQEAPLNVEPWGTAFTSVDANYFRQLCDGLRMCPCCTLLMENEENMLNHLTNSHMDLICTKCLTIVKTSSEMTEHRKKCVESSERQQLGRDRRGRYSKYAIQPSSEMASACAYRISCFQCQSSGEISNFSDMKSLANHIKNAHASNAVSKLKRSIEPEEEEESETEPEKKVKPVDNEEEREEGDNEEDDANNQRTDLTSPESEPSSSIVANCSTI